MSKKIYLSADYQRYSMNRDLYSIYQSMKIMNIGGNSTDKFQGCLKGNIIAIISAVFLKGGSE